MRAWWGTKLDKVQTLVGSHSGGLEVRGETMNRYEHQFIHLYIQQVVIGHPF